MIYTYIIYPSLRKDPCNIMWLLQSGKYDNPLFWERPIYYRAPVVERALSNRALLVESALYDRALSFPLHTSSFRRMPHLDRSFSAKEPYNYRLFCGKSLSERALSFPLHTSSFRRPIGCHILIGHFPQKSRIISGSFAERDLQLRHPMHLRHTVSSYGCFLARSTKIVL